MLYKIIVLLFFQRTYWIVPLDTLAIGRLKHTHVQTVGIVKYVNPYEIDGDTHIKLVSLKDSTKFIIAECIPRLLCSLPRINDTITVFGITRMDIEHKYPEIHPVENWIKYVKSP